LTAARRRFWDLVAEMVPKSKMRRGEKSDPINQTTRLFHPPARVEAEKK